jgi:peptide-methionine (R)-S-oxide reductase
MKRRRFLGAIASMPFIGQQAQARLVAYNYQITHTDAEWREMLSPAEYHVMREGGREIEGSSSLVALSADGIYKCRGCDLEVYAAEDKIHPGQGWPAFQGPLYPDAVRTVEDRPAIHRASEVHCRRCESHLGDIAPEPVSPTGEIHLLNGIALIFLPVPVKS